MIDPDCPLCQGASSDGELLREEVWSDELWRLTASLVSETPGFCYLEPRRHVTDVTALDGEEARTLGPLLGRTTAALKEATGAELVYVYVFGAGIDHLHLHLAPHRAGDALNDAIIRGELVEHVLPSGMTELLSDEFPPLPAEELRVVAARARDLLEQDEL